MQTFLPFNSFFLSARVLDRQRLGKQRVEAKQILMCLSGTGSTRWGNHPAVKMWKGHERALALYGWAICREWTSRGYRDSLTPFFQDYCPIGESTAMPSWLGDLLFHRSHRSNLLRKAPLHYAPHFEADLPADLEYVWPIPAALPRETIERPLEASLHG